MGTEPSEWAKEQARRVGAAMLLKYPDAYLVPIATALDAARIAGVRAGLEAAGAVCASHAANGISLHTRDGRAGARACAALIRALDPTTIAAQSGKENPK